MEEEEMLNEYMEYDINEAEAEFLMIDEEDEVEETGVSVGAAVVRTGASAGGSGTKANAEVKE